MLIFCWKVKIKCQRSQVTACFYYLLVAETVPYSKVILTVPIPRSPLSGRLCRDVTPAAGFLYPLNTMQYQGVRHADENGGGGRRPGGSGAIIFFRGSPIPKTENSADLAHYFPENGGIIPRTLKNGGTRPPVPPVAKPLCNVAESCRGLAP